ncbi:hypothetical protein SERLA73DRAFT_149298 [Serpula lacrymans var. lacrymans S7.3]|uniref:Uncharacterized protein n=1 Tax=Serpula lacrymans var. lacrymans (strain S7.3) TaxID=936435 RepID=F8PHL4_SERL3|nr:hypothetical protein SERLA73DRAFT_149298 [Serpula lacrymans var. lacrymans S7.3]
MYYHNSNDEQEIQMSPPTKPQREKLDENKNEHIKWRVSVKAIFTKALEEQKARYKVNELLEKAALEDSLKQHIVGVEAQKTADKGNWRKQEEEWPRLQMAQMEADKAAGITSLTQKFERFIQDNKV